MSTVIIYPGMLCISVNSNISKMSRTDSPYVPPCNVSSLVTFDNRTNNLVYASGKSFREDLSIHV